MSTTVTLAAPCKLSIYLLTLTPPHSPIHVVTQGHGCQPCLVHPTRLNYLQISSSSYADGLAAGKRKITSSPTLSVRFCCKCYLYVNHELMNNMTCIAAPGYCSLHKSVIMLDVIRQHADDTISCFFLLVNRNGTSSASSLGLADLDAFSDVPTQSTVIR